MIMKTPKFGKEEGFFYENMRTLRLMHRLTQNYIADVVGMSQVYYSKTELGEKRITLARAIKIAKLYNVSLDTLIEKDLREASDVVFRKFNEGEGSL